MTRALLTRSFRVLSLAALCLASSLSNLWADPINVTSGAFVLAYDSAGFGYFTFSGADGFFLSGTAVPSSLVAQSCPSGCRPGDLVNLSVVAGTRIRE